MFPISKHFLPVLHPEPPARFTTGLINGSRLPVMLHFLSCASFSASSPSAFASSDELASAPALLALAGAAIGLFAAAVFLLADSVFAALAIFLWGSDLPAGLTETFETSTVLVAADETALVAAEGAGLLVAGDEAL